MRLLTWCLSLVLLPLLCLAASHDDYPSFSSTEDRLLIVDGSLSFTDDAVYGTGWFSVDGAAWESFSLMGSPYGSSGGWLSGQAGASLPSFGPGEHYVVAYSCSYDAGWDCHGGKWQLYILLVTPAGEIAVVQGGVAAADIVVSSDAPSMVALAAQYFQDDMRAMTGATLPITNNPDPSYDYHVFIGKSNYTDNLGVTCDDCRDGGFRIVTKNNALIMLGDDEPFVDLTLPDDEFDAFTTPDHWTNSYNGWRNYHKNYDLWQQDGRGSMNAVHELLRRQGMRWYYPSDIGTITPSKQTVTFQPTDETINPDFAMRAPYISYKKFGHLVSSHYPEGGEFGYWEDHLRWILSLGINDVGEYVGGDWAHGLNHVTEQPETVAEHPEYYAVWSGNLMNGLDDNDMKQNLCSEELLQATIRYVKDMIDIYNVSTIGIWPVDGFSRVSESSQECIDMATPERGSTGAISDYVWEFMNTVAWAIHDDPAYGPDKMIQCGAYPAYQLPPLSLSDSRGLAPNIVIVITKHRSQTADPEMRQHYQDLTEEWLSILPSKTIYTWDYYLQNHADRSIIADYPAFYPHLIDEDLKFLKGKTNGEFIEVYSSWPNEDHSWDSFAAQALNVYVTTRLYWDVDQDVNALLNEYYDLYYGPAAEEMRAIVEYAEDNLPNAKENPLHLKHLRLMTQEAISKAAQDQNEVYAQRIEPLLNLINAKYEGEEIFLDSCGNLTSPATTYKLTGDVSANGDCFLLDADGITLDCQGHTITYSSDGVHSNDHAITVIEGHPTNTYRGDYFTIKNCRIQDGSYLSGNTTGTAIYFKGADHGQVLDNYINTSGGGITALSVNITYRRNEVHAYQGASYLTQHGDRNKIGPVSNNVLENNFFSSVESYGGRLYQDKNDTIINNTFSSKNTLGLYQYNVANMTYINNTFMSENALGLRTYGTATYVVFEGNVQIDG